jgi:hypothetical protein
VALEISTYADKQFLSNLTESASAATASVRTATEDGVLLLDSSLTLTNCVGDGVSFSFSFTLDPSYCAEHQSTFNDHESLEALQEDVYALLEAVNTWGGETLAAIDALKDAAAESA